MLPLTPDLRWYLNALIRETRTRAPGFRMKLDSLCSALLIDLVRLNGTDVSVEMGSDGQTTTPVGKDGCPWATTSAHCGTGGLVFCGVGSLSPPWVMV